MDAPAFPPPPQPPGHSAPGFPPPAAGMPAPAPATATEERPVGRPSGDPERDAERRRQQINRVRVESVLPRKATDPRFAVYRLKGPGTGVRARNKPSYEILVHEVEDACKNSGYDPALFIRERLIEKFGEKGKYEIVMQDSKGRPMPQYNSWTEDLEQTEGEEEVPNDEDDEEREELDEQLVSNFLSRQRPGPMLGNTPPPPPVGDAQPVVEMAREVRQALVQQHERESAKTDTSMAVMMQVMQQSTQMMVAMMNSSRDQESARMERERTERERLDRERREHEEKMRIEQERAEQRRREERTDNLKFLTATVLPIVAPIISKITEGKQDIVMPLLLDMVKGSNNNNAAKELMGMMQTAAKEQMLLQGEVSRQAIQSSGEVNKSMMAHVLGLSQEVTKTMLDAALSDQGSDDPIDKFQKIMKAVTPMLSNFSTPQQLPQPEVPRIAEEATEALGASQQLPQPAQHTLPQPTLPDAEKVRSCLHTLMQLETGAIKPEEYVKALEWCSKQLPKPLHNAILAGQQEQVVAITQPVIQADAVLVGWVMGDTDKVLEHLNASVKSIQKILLGSMDEAATKAALEYHLKYRSLRPQAQAPAPAPTAPKPPKASRPAPAKTKMPLGEDEPANG
jgi:hypothetical protein